MSNITRIQFFWDDRDPETAGWYAVASDADGDVIDDSEKVWFPVAVGDYGQEEGDDLAAALREAFPDAEIDGD